MGFKQGQVVNIDSFYPPVWRKTRSKQPRLVKVKSRQGGGQYMFDAKASHEDHNIGTIIEPHEIKVTGGYFV